MEGGGFWIIRGFKWFVTIGTGIWFKVGGLPWMITRELFRLYAWLFNLCPLLVRLFGVW